MSRNNDYVSTEVRRRIARQAAYVCEYCLLPEADSFLGYEIDHIIGLKHRGSNHETNLAWSCPDCNRNKGTDIGSIDWSSGDLVRFFNPRTDVWAEHFRLYDNLIEPLTPVGIVTLNILKLNDRLRPDERISYPSDN
jgi:HNH endonuclease